MNTEIDSATEGDIAAYTAWESAEWELDKAQLSGDRRIKDRAYSLACYRREELVSSRKKLAEKKALALIARRRSVDEYR